MMEERLTISCEFLGRLLLGSLFVLQAVSKLTDYSGTATYMSAYGVPGQLLPAVIAFEFGAGMLVAIGWFTRAAAFGLSVFCIAAAIIFHAKFSDGSQVLQFEKDLALAGAFLVLWARGAARLSLDALLTRSRRHPGPDLVEDRSGPGGA